MSNAPVEAFRSFAKAYGVIAGAYGDSVRAMRRMWDRLPAAKRSAAQKLIEEALEVRGDRKEMPSDDATALAERAAKALAFAPPPLPSVGDTVFAGCRQGEVREVVMTEPPRAFVYFHDTGKVERRKCRALRSAA